MSQHRLWCAISGHGFGHLSQVASLLKQLAKRIPTLHVRVVTALPHAVLARLLDCDFSSECRVLDVGLVQSDPMRIDLQGTVSALRLLHGDWEKRLDIEKRAMAVWQPDLLLSDIPYLAIAAAADLGIPTVAVASLSWDAVLAAYFSLKDPEVHGWWQTMRQSYARTTLALLPAPAIVKNSPFNSIEHINPLATPGQCRYKLLRQVLGVTVEDDRPLILDSLGGIPARHLPVDVLARETRFHWLLDVPLPDHPGHLHSFDALLATWNFADLAASVDAIVSKPGYGMAIAAGTQQIPFLYVRRGLFPDESPICAWLAKWSCCQELESKDFYAGNWYEPLRVLLDRPLPARPQVNGAEQGTEIIAGRFFGT